MKKLVLLPLLLIIGLFTVSAADQNAIGNLSGRGIYNIYNFTNISTTVFLQNSNNVLDIISTFGGDVSGTNASLQLGTGVVGSNELASTTVAASSYGNATHIPTYTVDADGRLTAATNTPINISLNQVFFNPVQNATAAGAAYYSIGYATNSSGQTNLLALPGSTLLGSLTGLTSANNANGSFNLSLATSANPLDVPHFNTTTGLVSGSIKDDGSNVNLSGTVNITGAVITGSTITTGDSVVIPNGARFQAGASRITCSSGSTQCLITASAGSNGRQWLLVDDSYIATSFAHGIQSNPTLFIHANSTDTHMWIGITHNSTNPVISSGLGNIKLINNTDVIGTLSATTLLQGSVGVLTTISNLFNVTNGSVTGVVNGTNSLTFTAGTNIGISQSSNTLTINNLLTTGNGLSTSGTVFSENGTYPGNKIIAGNLTVNNDLIVSGNTTINNNGSVRWITPYQFFPATVLTATADQLYCLQFSVPFVTKVFGMQLASDATSSGNVSAAIYTQGSAGTVVGGTLLINSTLVNTAPGSFGWKVIPFTANYSLNPGTYYMCTVFSSSLDTTYRSQNIQINSEYGFTISRAYLNGFNTTVAAANATGSNLPVIELLAVS